MDEVERTVRKNELKLRKKPVYWTGHVGVVDDFGDKIKDELFDAPTIDGGRWALMTRQTWVVYGRTTKLGTGLGQRFKKQDDGRWLKVEG
jgi:hypothetical protein